MTVRLHGKNGLRIDSPQRWIGGDENNPAVGTVRWSKNNQCLQIYTGNNCWTDHVQDFELSLDHDWDRMVIWVKEKMAEEQDLKQRMAKYPSLQDAYEQFKVVDLLTREHDVKSS